MRSFAEKTGGQFFLLFFIGFYLIVAVCMEFRNVLADSESAVLGVGVAMTFTALWCYLGGMVLPYEWLEKRTRHGQLLSPWALWGPTAALLSALIGRMTIMLPENVHAGIHLINIALMTLPVGLWAGVLLAILHSGGFPLGRYLNYFGLALGMLTSGIVLALAVERAVWGDHLLILAGSGVVLWALGSGCRVIRSMKGRGILLGLSALALGINVLIFYSAQWILKNELRHRLPGWGPIRSVELPVGRMSFFREQGADAVGEHGGYRIYLNRRLMWTLPNDAELYASGLMPVMIQNMQPNQRVLMVAPPFYNGIFLLASMPQIGQIDVVCPYQSLFEFSRENGLFGAFVKTMYFAVDPMQYLSLAESNYHAIIVIDPGLLPPGKADEFVALARKKLTPDGVFAMPAPFSGNPLAGSFKYTARVPGCRSLLMGSGKGLFTDVKELGESLDNFMKTLNVTSFFPAGTFEVLYSHSERTTVPGRGMAIDNSVSNVLSLTPRGLTYWEMVLLAAVLGGYFWFRFFLIRHRNNALKVTALENGICGAGFFYLVIMLYQWHDLMLYQQLGMLLGMSGMIFLGELAPLRPVLRILVTAGSCLLPLVIFYRGDFDIVILPGALAWMSISLGQVARELDRRRTVLSSAELSKWFLGGAFYGFAGFLIVLCVANLLICCIVLIVLRLFALGMMFGTRK